MYDVACIGILVADVIASPVDKIPDRGKLSLVGSMKLFSGGCAMNASVDLSKLSSSVAMLGMVGNDGFGKFLKEELEKYNVNTEGLVENDSINTSSSVVLVDSGGERSFLHSIGANGVFAENNVHYPAIENSKIVFVAGSLLMPSFDGAGCAVTLKKARGMGKITVLDTAWDDTGRWMKTLEPCLPYVDYFIPSIEEAQMLSGETEPEKIAQVFFNKGVKSVVVKLGKKGCYMQESKNQEGIYIPTYDKIKPVDTTGAGDSFCAGFLYGLAKGKSMLHACQIANAVGTHCIMAFGASTGIKPYSEIEKFIIENGGWLNK